MNELLSTGDASRIIGITNIAVIAAANRGELPVAFKTPTGRRLFRREDVMQLVNARAKRAALRKIEKSERAKNIRRLESNTDIQRSKRGK